MKTSGIIILLVGLLMTVYTGFTYITKDKVVDIGEVQISKDNHHDITWQPLMGFGVMVAGGVVLLLGRKK